MRPDTGSQGLSRRLASYLGSRALISSIFQQVFYDVDVVLLGSHVQRSEAILRTNNEKDNVSHL